MASMVFNKRGIQSQLGKVGRQMAKDHEILRYHCNGFAFVLEQWYGDRYLVSCYYSNDAEDFDYLTECTWIEVCWGVISLNHRGLVNFGLGAFVHEVTRSTSTADRQYLRFRLDVNDNEVLFRQLECIIEWHEAKDHYVYFPTDEKISCVLPMIEWTKVLNQDELIMEQQEA